MRRFWIRALALVCSSALSSAAAVADGVLRLYVSPCGNDSSSGCEDAPLLTCEGARERLRSIRAKKPELLRCGAEVVLKDGCYILARPLELVASDSGHPDAEIVWKAEHDRQVVISGRTTPVMSRQLGDPKILSRLPESVRGKVIELLLPDDVVLTGFTASSAELPADIQENPISVFAGERRLTVARWPDDGFTQTKTEGNKSGEFGFVSEKLSDWKAEEDLWAFGLWHFEWSEGVTRILTVDDEAGRLAVDMRPVGFGIVKNAKFYVFNALCELDKPGEYVVDRIRRRVYLLPPMGTGNVNYSIAAADGLIRAKGLHHVTFRGITFEFSRGDALQFVACSNCSVVASVVRHTSAGAIKMLDGSGNRVAGCDLWDLGKGGVVLEGGDRETLVRGENVAENNHIGHYGKVIYNYLPGISLRGVGNRAEHNLVHHSRHQGIFFNGNDHYIGWNIVHDVCTYNDDAGAIYCCQRDWTKRGTIVERNVVHMTGNQPRCSHVKAIYLDDYSSGVTVRGNLINRAEVGVFIGGGQDNVVDGNVIMNCVNGIELGTRGCRSPGWNKLAAKGRKSYVYERMERMLPTISGPVWRGRYPRLHDLAALDDAVFAHEALWNVITNNVLAGCGGIDKANWPAMAPFTTLTNNVSMAVDPGFVNYWKMDWELSSTSCVRRLIGETGFAKMGLYASPDRASSAVRFSKDITPPRSLHVEYSSSKVRVDLVLAGSLPSGIPAVARDCKGCNVPTWGHGVRITAGFGKATDEWTVYELSFVPAFDCALDLMVMGARGEKTFYDDFAADGTTIDGGDFEAKGWRVVPPDPGDHRWAVCNVEKPWGIVDGMIAGVDGKVACANELISLVQRISVRKNRPVRIRFKARACIAATGNMENVNVSAR